MELWWAWSQWPYQCPGACSSSVCWYVGMCIFLLHIWKCLHFMQCAFCVYVYVCVCIYIIIYIYSWVRSHCSCLVWEVCLLCLSCPLLWSVVQARLSCPWGCQYCSCLLHFCFCVHLSGRICHHLWVSDGVLYLGYHVCIFFFFPCGMTVGMCSHVLDLGWASDFADRCGYCTNCFQICETVLHDNSTHKIDQSIWVTDNNYLCTTNI